MTTDNWATTAGTARYARRFLDRTEPLDAGHSRPALGLTLSSIGAGAYLGDVSDAEDERYRLALIELA